MTDLNGLPGPGLEEYAAKATTVRRPPAHPVLVEVGIRTTTHPDGTGYQWLRDRAGVAVRQRDLAAERGCLTWRLVVRASYRAALAAPEGSDDLYDALGVLLADVASWRADLSRREGNDQ